MVSFCTGAYVLAEAGLLDGRPATTLWTHAERFRARFPAVRLNPAVLYGDDGQVLTSAGNAAPPTSPCTSCAATTGQRSPTPSPARWSRRRTGAAARPSTSRHH